jgi:hypothetical protein
MEAEKELLQETLSQVACFSLFDRSCDQSFPFRSSNGRHGETAHSLWLLTTSCQREYQTLI